MGVIPTVVVPLVAAPAVTAPAPEPKRKRHPGIGSVVTAAVRVPAIIRIARITAVIDVVR